MRQVGTQTQMLQFGISQSPGSTIYAAGEFTNIGGQTRKYIAALDTAGESTSWNPNPSDVVWSITISGSTIYAGGWFFSVGGLQRNHIAALDAMTGRATSWNPNAGGAVGASLAFTGSAVRVAEGEGNYIDPIHPEKPTYASDVQGPFVHTLAVFGSTVYAADQFTNIAGQTRRYIAAIDSPTTD